jgi:hypothetical protein
VQAPLRRLGEDPLAQPERAHFRHRLDLDFRDPGHVRADHARLADDRVERGAAVITSERFDALGGDSQRPYVVPGVRPLVGWDVGKAEGPPERIRHVVADPRPGAHLRPCQLLRPQAHEPLHVVGIQGWFLSIRHSDRRRLYAPAIAKKARPGVAGGWCPTGPRHLLFAWRQ